MKKSIFLSLALALVLSSTLSFAPAPTVDAAKPANFEAGIIVWPLEPADNEDHGNSHRLRTIEELHGGVIPYSTWGPIAGGSISMSTTTNFIETDSGAFSGPFHSTLTITTADGRGTITLNVAGKIEGQKDWVRFPARTPSGYVEVYMIVYADINGKFNSTGATDSLAGTHVNGDLKYKIDFTGGFPGINGGTLKGTYN